MNQSRLNNVQRGLLVTLLKEEPLYLPTELDTPKGCLALQDLVRRENGTTDGPDDPSEPHYRYWLTTEGRQVAEALKLLEDHVLFL